MHPIKGLVPPLAKEMNSDRVKNISERFGHFDTVRWFGDLLVASGSGCHNRRSMDGRILAPTRESRSMVDSLIRICRQTLNLWRANSRRSHAVRFLHDPSLVEILESRRLLTAGDLDATFGVGGHVQTEYATSTDASRALATVVQSDGKIVAAGEGGIVRFLADGSLDATFGTEGRVQYPFHASSIAIQANGSIVVGGGTAQNNSVDFVVSRYLTNGTLDTSFHADGHAQVSFGGTIEYANDVAVQANGRIVVVGRSDTQIAVARLTSAGALDTTFSGDGLLLKSIYTTSNEANAAAIQPDGKILVAGSTWSYSYSSSVHDFFVMRLNSNGSTDATFDTDGVATIGGGRQAVVRDLTLLSNGQMVVSGWSDAGFKSNVLVTKFNADGSPDTTFDGDGRALAALSDSVQFRNGGEAHVVLADGSIVVSASSRLIKFGANGVQDTAAFRNVMATSVSDIVALSGDNLLLAGQVSGRFGVAEVDADRKLLITFSGDGLAPVEFGNSDDIAGRSIQQRNGRIVVASTSLNTFAVTRYLPTGALDTTFSQDGKVTINFGARYLNASASDVAVQADGRIVVVGYVAQVDSPDQMTVSNHIAVARLNARGTLDTTFGTNGMVVTQLNGYARATTVKIQSNGRIVVGGQGNGGYFTLLRYLANGTLDNSFSGDGVQTIYNSNVNASVLSDLVIRRDGKILAVGDVSPYITGQYPTTMAIVRFNSNGSLDASFGTNGRVVTGAMRQRTGQRLALLADGSLYVGGNETQYVSGTFYSQMALSRFTASGQLVFQKIITPFIQTYAQNPTSITPLNSTLNSILVQPDGRVVMSGSAGTQLGIMRVNADGTDDSSFGGDGRSLVTLPANGTYFGSDVVRQANARLVIPGSFRPNGSNRRDLLLTRLESATPTVPSTTVFAAANGQIQIRDNWSRDDSLSVEVVGTNLQVQDLTPDSKALFIVSGLPEVMGSGTKTIIIPLSRLQQSSLPLLLDTRIGNDTALIKTNSEDADSFNVTYLAGAGTDKLVQTSVNLGATWNINSAGSGSLKSGDIASPGAFSSVENFVGGPLADVFRLQAGSTPTWMVVDGGAGPNDSIEITGDADMKLTNAIVEVRGGLNQNLAILNFESGALSGGASANVLDAFFFPGNVTLRGFGGDDKLIGGQGDDSLRGDAGSDVLIGNEGNDVIFGGDGDDLLVGATGNDHLSGEKGRDILEGGSGTDVLRGGDGEDILISGSAYGLGTYYGSDTERNDIRAAWSDTSLTYEQRVVAIRDTGVGSGTPSSRLTVGYSVFADQAFDELFGDADRDWFFATTVSVNSIDLFTDRQLDEDLTLLN